MKILLTWAIMSLCILQFNAVEAKEKKVKVDSQLICLAKNIYYEAGLESYEGKIAVAQVTLNRTEHDKFPNTVCGVVNQKTQITSIEQNKPKVITVCQFSWVCQPMRSISYISNTWKQSLEVARQVMYNGLVLDDSDMEDALYFHNTKVRPKWKLERLGKIGNHIFYSDNPVIRRS